MICSSLYAIDFAVKLITFSFPNNMNPARASNNFRPKCNNISTISTTTDLQVYPCLPSPYILNERGNPSPSPSTTTSDPLRNPFRSAKTARCRDQLLCAVHIRQPRTIRLRTDGVKDEKLLVRLWAESKASREIAQDSKHGLMFCSDFVLKCDCSFPDNFFGTGRFQVRFVQNKI